MTTPFLLGFLATAGFAQTSAPSTLNAGGGSKVINGQSYDYSVGEMVLVNTATASNIIVTQGLLQPQEDQETGIADHFLDDGQLSVYPNPFEDVVNLKANLPASGILYLDVYDVHGKLIVQRELAIATGKENTNLSLQNLAAGNYVLKAKFESMGSTHFQSFKIQKMK